MSVDFSRLVGNADLKNGLARDIRDRTLSHAYIIEGPRGSGKHTLAYSIAAALACSSKDGIPCGRCRNCEKIFSGNSTDVITVGIEDDKVTMGIEAARHIKEDMPLAPNELEQKVYVIEDTDVMTPQAQNALLLSLEEPPSYVMFLLLCENSTSLLETIRSRAPSLRLEHLCDAEVERYLLKNDNRAKQLCEEEAEAFKTVVHAAQGCIGKALELLGGRRRKTLLEEREIAERIVSLLSDPSTTEALSVATLLGNKRADVIRCLTAVEYAVRDLIVLKKAENAHLCFYHNKEEAQELSAHFTSTALMSLYDALTKAINDLEANLNVKLTVLNMMQNSGLI